MSVEQRAAKAAKLAALVTIGLCAFAIVVGAVVYALIELGGAVALGGEIVVFMFVTLWLCAWHDLATRKGDEQ